MGAYDVNLLAVLIAAIASMFVGFVWYSPLVCGNVWMKVMKLSSRDLKKMKKDSQRVYAGALIVALIMAYALAVVLNFALVTDFTSAARVVLLVWLGFMFTKSFARVIWERSSHTLLWITAGHELASLLVMAAVLLYWPA